jgi:hypothetical protein
MSQFNAYFIRLLQICFKDPRYDPNRTLCQNVGPKIKLHYSPHMLKGNSEYC